MRFGRRDAMDALSDIHLTPPTRGSLHLARAADAYLGAPRLNWPAILTILGLHAAAFTALVLFDVVQLVRPRPVPTLITLVPDQIAPLAPPPPPAAAKVSDTPPPPDAPVVPQLIATTAVTPAPALVVPPPAPVVAPPTPALVVAAEAPAPIVPPDVSAATATNPPPSYPMESRRRREQGTVRLRIVVGTDGNVRDITVAHSSGFDRLDRAALEAVRRWHFRPGSQAGVPVEAVGFLPIPFRLA